MELRNLLFGGELRVAARRFRKAPSFAFVSALNLALGIGATVAIFTVLYGVLLRPLPYPEADRLVVIEHELPGFEVWGGAATRFGGFQGQVPYYLERSRGIVEMGAFGSFDAAITEPDSPQYVRIGYASAGFFRALGVVPQLGRLFRDQEPTTDEVGNGVSLLGHPLWVQRYGADEGAIGRGINTEGFPREIVGVLPESFRFPSSNIRVWHPRPAEHIREHPGLLVAGMVARLAPGATAESLQVELNALMVGLPESLPDDFVRRTVNEGGLRARVTPMKDWIIGDVGRGLWLLMAGGLLVLLIGWVNVANLLLVRSDARRTETAVRLALGAGHRDLLRLFCAEGFLMAATAGLAAWGLATAGIRTLLRFAPAGLPRLEEISLGGESLVATVLLSLATWLLVTVLPYAASRSARSQPSPGTRATADRPRLRLRSLLAGSELALAVILLVASGLIIRSFSALTRVEPGFEPDSVLTFRVPYPFQEIQQAGRQGGIATPFYDGLVERFAALPGVVSVGYGKCLPLSQTCGLEGLTFRRADLPVEASSDPPLFGVLQVGEGYHKTLGIPLLAGRYLQRYDHQERSNAVLISASLAADLWPDRDPVGGQLVTNDVAFTPFTVVGVVGDVHHAGLRGDPEPVVYTPIMLREQDFEVSTVSFVVRTAVPPLSLANPVRSTVSRLRPDVPVANVGTMREHLHRSTARLRFAMWLLAAAAASALLLGAVGVYGVISYAVSLRRSEFGIRLALGAQKRQLRMQVLRQAAVMTSLGLGAGLLGAALASRLMRALLFGVEPTDPLTYITVLVFLAATALAAALLPAHRASGLDPAEILRAQ